MNACRSIHKRHTDTVTLLRHGPGVIASLRERTTELVAQRNRFDDPQEFYGAKSGAITSMKARAEKIDSEAKELTAVWKKAAQDELAISPGQRCIADLLLLSCRHYAELIAFRKTYSSQLRQFYGLCKDADHARRPADEADSDTVLGKRHWPQGGSDSANSAATTPRSAASTPTGWPGTASGPNDGPPEEEERSEAVPELAIAAENDAVPHYLQGKVVDVFDRRANSAGRPFYAVRLASDPRGPKEWVQAVHVLPLTTPTTAPRTRRQLAPTLDVPGSPPSGREAGFPDRRHLGEAQSSSGGLRLSPLDASPKRFAQDVDLAALLQGGREEGQSPTYPESCSYDTGTCLPTTRHCKHPGCSRLVCDPCAQKMCPDGENENDYHLCARHMPRTDEEDEGDSDSSDLFAWRKGGHKFLYKPSS